MMVLSTKGRYAARIMVYLATCDENVPVTKYEIGNAEDISSDYIEQIMIRLKAQGLVKSHRGRKGGFSLSRKATDISLAEVLTALEGPVCPAPCIESNQCARIKSCPMRSIWLKTTEMLESLFSATTIAQMAGVC